MVAELEEKAIGCDMRRSKATWSSMLKYIETRCVFGLRFTFRCANFSKIPETFVNSNILFALFLYILLPPEDSL